jgi:hopene-associated glycosyltransferase HpnB
LARIVYGLALIVALASLAIWIYLLTARGGFWRMTNDPGEAGKASEVERHPMVVAVIPARNEAANIGDAVRSLVSQVPVIVVDDDSEDGTAAIAREAGAVVVTARPLEPGWSGKLWALNEGLRSASAMKPDFWLLTDADIVHAPDSVAGLLARARAGDYALVSYMVMLECRSLAERALIPAFIFFFFQLYPPAWIRDPKHRAAGAAGGCILVSREALARIGGIGHIRGELIDDCALAREVKATGRRVWLGLTTATRSVRGYGSFEEIGRMISRTAFTQLGYSWWVLAGTVAGLALTYLAPPLLTLFAPAGAPRGLGALAWLAMTLAYLPVLRLYRQPWYWAPMLPAIALFYTGATIHSALEWQRGRGGMWKGRAQAVK